MTHVGWFVVIKITFWVNIVVRLLRMTVNVVIEKVGAAQLISH